MPSLLSRPKERPRKRNISEGEAESEESEESVLGIDLESPLAVASGVLLSLLLAAGLWFTDRRDAAIVAAVFAGVFAVFDVAEVVHQLDESTEDSQPWLA